MLIVLQPFKILAPSVTLDVANCSRVACTKEAATQNQLPDIRPDLTFASWLLAIVSLQQAKSPAAACSWQNHPRLMPPMPLMPQRTLAAKFPAAWPGRVVTPPYPKPAAANAGGVPLLVKLADAASIETLVSPAASLLAAASLLFF